MREACISSVTLFRRQAGETYTCRQAEEIVNTACERRKTIVGWKNLLVRRTAG
jgi:hypothetical protein